MLITRGYTKREREQKMKRQEFRTRKAWSAAVKQGAAMDSWTAMITRGHFTRFILWTLLAFIFTAVGIVLAASTIHSNQELCVVAMVFTFCVVYTIVRYGAIENYLDFKGWCELCADYALGVKQP